MSKIYTQEDLDRCLEKVNAKNRAKSIVRNKVQLLMDEWRKEQDACQHEMDYEICSICGKGRSHE